MENMVFNIQLLSLVHHTNIIHFDSTNSGKRKKRVLAGIPLDLQVANIELYLNTEEKSQQQNTPITMSLWK